MRQTLRNRSCANVHLGSSSLATFVHGCRNLGYSSILPGTSLSNSVLPTLAPANSDAQVPESRPESHATSADLLPSLRDALASGKETPAAIFHAVAEAACILVNADGIAIAVRTKAQIICRARSGDLAPDIGSPLNLDSGISGECLRTATILVCNDAENDSRVDPDVCRVLGIRSVVAVPLRGPMGIAGILEAFSSRPSAFGDEQINALRELAQIAEAAYDRECRERDLGPTPAKSATRRELLSALVVRRKNEEPRKQESSKLSEENQKSLSEIFNEPSHERRYWLLGGAGLAALLIAGVVWLSWHDPTPEAAASEPPVPSVATQANSAAQAPIRDILGKPEAGTTRPSSASLRGGLRNASQVQSDAVAESQNVIALSSDATESVQPKTEDFAPVPAPSVSLAESNSASKLPNLAISAAPMPSLDIPISQGLTQGVLVHKVAPAYPTQARLQRIDGSVVMNATIAEDGTVKAVKVVSGPPQLAAAAKDAVRQWRYSPPLLNGKPIELQKQITVVFKLPS